MVVVVYFLFTLTLVTKRGLYPLRAEDILNLGLLTVILAFVGVFVIMPPLLIHLDVTPDAIVYYGPGYSIRAPWSAVAGTGTMWSGARRLRGLVLDRPDVTVRPWLAALLRFAPTRAYLTYLNRYPLPVLEGNEAYRRFIPVDLFVARRRSEVAVGAWVAIEAIAPRLGAAPASSDTQRLVR